MLKILVGPNGCGKSQYLSQLSGGGNCRMHETSGIQKLAEIHTILEFSQESKVDISIDDVDIYIDIDHIKELCDALLEASKTVDVWVSTHNPLFLNYFDAVNSVFLVKNGQLYPFFSGEVLEKLEIMSPGEAYADTDLNEWWKQQ